MSVALSARGLLTCMYSGWALLDSAWFFRIWFYYSWLNVTLKLPLYAPGGADDILPTVNVPPIFTLVVAGGETVVLKGEPGSELPICSVILPPLLPVKVASGPFVMDINDPGAASTSNCAWK